MAITSALDLVKNAKSNIENLTPHQVAEELKNGKAILVDIRETHELSEQGKIPGSVNAPRGMLEFYADPSLPYHKAEFQPENRIILQCASGGRSALAAQTLKQMGYNNVAHLDGGIKAWKENNLTVE
ncbi:MAG TPA: rhodanese-like domain-containing protein [Chitinophagaceae bacterium]